MKISALVALGFWFIIQFLNALVEGGSHGGVAWHARVAGLVAGIFLIGFFKRNSTLLWGGRTSRYL